MSDDSEHKDTPDSQEESAAPPGTLRPEDQKRVDAFLKRGVNSVDRKPFKPLYLLILLVVVVLSLSIFSQWLARQAGVY